MSRVGAWHIGIERLDLAHAEPFAPPLPERHLLAPDGRPVETHVASLYPAQQAQQRLFDYARPQLEFHGLLRPGDFRRALRDLRLASRCPASRPAGRGLPARRARRRRATAANGPEPVAQGMNR